MKKVCALILSVIMCMTMLMAVPFTAQAATTMSISYGFEEETLGVVDVGNGVTYRQQSPVFNDSHFYPQGSPTFEIVEDGYVGQAMKITEDGGKAFQVGLEAVNPAAGETAYYNFKLKILEDMGTPNVSIRFGSTQMAIFRNEASYPNGPVIFMQGRKTGYYYENNEWYDVTVISSGDSQRVDMIVKDAKGNVYTGYRNSDYKYPVIRSHDSDTDGAALAGTSILLDEIKIIQGTHDEVLNLISTSHGEIVVPSNKEVIATEGFDDASITNIHNYANASAALSAPALWSSYVTTTMIDDGNGGYAPQLTSISGKQACVSTEPVEIGDDKTFVFFRFKPVDQGTGIIGMTLNPASPGSSNGHDVLIRGGRFDTLSYWGSKSNFTFTPNMWYNFVFEFENVDGTNQATLHVYDDQYNKVLGSAPVPGTKPTNGAGAGVISNALVSVYQYNGVSTWAIDDVKIVKTAEENSEAFILNEFGKRYFKNEVVATEAFNDANITNLHSYANSSAALSSPALWDSYVTHTMVDDCNGGYAPQLTSISGKQACVSTEPVEIGDDKTFVSMRFKVVDQGTGIIGMTLNPATPGGSNGYDILIRNGRIDTWNYWGRIENYTFVPDMWYNFIFEFENVDGTNQATLHVYDDEYNKVLGSAPVSGKTPNNGAGSGVISNALVSLYQYTGVSTWSMDDVKIIKTTEEDTEAFIKSEIFGKKLDLPAAPQVDNTVYTTKPVIKVGFDQIVGEASVVAFKSEGKSDVAGVVRYAGSTMVDIYPATPLEYDTEYVLDISGVKGLAGQGLASASSQGISFHTAPYSMGTMTAGEETIADGKLTVPVTFTNEDVEELNVTLIAALFNGDKLVWTQTKNVEAAKMGENTFTFTKLPENAENLEFRVFAWDNFVALNPLYK